MKAQATMAVLILAVFVGWLFYQTYDDHQLQIRRIQMEEAKLADAEIQGKYTILNDPDGVTYLLNTKTGETWRWYRNFKNGTSEMETEGWAPVVFSVGGFDFSNTSKAQEFNEFLLRIERESKLENAKKGTKKE